MPEMPEVETVVRSLQPHLTDRRIRLVNILDPKLKAFDGKRVNGRKIRNVFRSGKEIVLDLSKRNNPLWMCVHLRMTGKLIWLSGKTKLNKRHLRARFILDRGRLDFYDSRRFGVMRVCDKPEQWAPPGVEPLSKDFSLAKLTEMLKGSMTPIKPWLLRQDRIVGFGNIYASEVLYFAGIDPRKPAGTLSPAEIKHLHQQTRRVFRKAIKYGGTTIFDFMDCEGECGGYQRFLKVYGDEGEPCPQCGKPIHRIVQQGRSTFFCSKCQR